MLTACLREGSESRLEHRHAGHTAALARSLAYFDLPSSPISPLSPLPQLLVSSSSFTGSTLESVNRSDGGLIRITAEGEPVQLSSWRMQHKAQSEALLSAINHTLRRRFHTSASAVAA